MSNYTLSLSFFNDYELSNELKINSIRYPKPPKGWLRKANSLFYE